MKKRILKRVILINILLIFLFTICSCGSYETDEQTSSGTNSETEVSVPDEKETGLPSEKIAAVFGGYEVSGEELEFRYRIQVQDFVQKYGTFMPLFQLNTSVPFHEQPYGEDPSISWARYFLDCSLEELANTAFFCFEAEKSEKKQFYAEKAEEYAQSQVDVMDRYAASNEMDAETFIQTVYGETMTVQSFHDYIYRARLATLCCSDILDGYTVSEDFFAEYYSANEEACAAEDYFTVNVRHILIVPEKTGVFYHEDGSENPEATEKAALEAEEKAKAKAQAIYDEITEKGITAELFAEYAEKFSQDKGSNGNGGLYSEVGKGFFNEVFDSWCFDENRKEGDCEVIRTADGYDVMYFDSFGEKLWHINAKADLRTANYEKLKVILAEEYGSVINEEVVSEIELLN